MRKSLLILWSACLLAGAPAVFADDFDDFLKDAEEDFQSFKKKSEKEYEDFRQKANDEMAQFMGKPWTPMRQKPVLVPEPDPEPEPIINEDDIHSRPLPKSEPVPLKEIIDIPAPKPQPQPVAPIKEVPAPAPLNPITGKFYGTPYSLRGADLGGFRLDGTSRSDFAQGWLYLSDDRTNNLIVDCLAVRDKLNLCDWAYMSFLKQVAGNIASGKPNETALLTGFLLCQSGYQMRLVIDGNRNLHVFYASSGHVFNVPRIFSGGKSYYALTKPSTENVEVCEFGFPQEKEVSFGIDRHQNFAYSPGNRRNLTAKFHPELSVDVTVNKNLIDFFNDYPEATLTDSPYSKWAIYANYPASPEVRASLYPAVKKAIQGKSQRDAANILLHLCETFPYKYDTEMWGRDRAFFTEESWHYLYSDCEDHAIHFSRLVRDLLGLDVALVYYPGHLASAVAFTDPSITGDYIVHNGRRYTVCDPTIFYSNIGETMQGMDNAKAILVDLKR